jgi:uncharacterized protein (TIGR00255 family)
MIRSMTGFAAHSLMLTLNQTKVTVSLSLKSLNARYFDTSFKMPYPINTLETEFITLFKTALHRGSISFSVHVSNPNAFKGAVEPSINTIQNYLNALNSIKERFSIKGELSIADILALPNIFNLEEQELDAESKKAIFDATHLLIKELTDMQNKEGLALKKDLQERIAVMTKEIAAIEKAFEILITNQKQKVHAAVADFEKDETKFAEMHKDALYAVLDKIDVHEEIVRFKSHLKNIVARLESPEIETGKRIDFILQELSREINTIMAKCSDATISEHAINVKVELEKSREQAQNIV